MTETLARRRKMLSDISSNFILWVQIPQRCFLLCIVAGSTIQCTPWGQWSQRNQLSSIIFRFPDCEIMNCYYQLKFNQIIFRMSDNHLSNQSVACICQIYFVTSFAIRRLVRHLQPHSSYAICKFLHFSRPHLPFLSSPTICSVTRHSHLAISLAIHDFIRKSQPH